MKGPDLRRGDLVRLDLGDGHERHLIVASVTPIPNGEQLAVIPDPTNEPWEGSARAD